MSVQIGTAGWAIPRASAERFGDGASALARYATRFSCVEINSTFYRSHRESTYRRWSASVPDDFRFSLKLPRTITHERRLAGVEEELDAFLHETSALAGKRDVLLVQLPPSAAYDASVAEPFFTALRARWDGHAACEPRHASWFDSEPDAMLRRYRIARVAADPLPVAAAGQPGGWEDFTYRRLHGSPVIYRSPYDPAALDALATALQSAPAESWCIFDNTASGAAAANALDLLARLSAAIPRRHSDPEAQAASVRVI